MVEELRGLVQTFVRQFGLLSPDRTPCGRPLPPSDAHALMVLGAAGEDGLPQSALARRLGIDKSTASRLVARLTESGHLAAGTSDDGRVRPVLLTRKGERLAGEVDESSRRRFAALLAQIPAARRARVVESLRDVVEALARLDTQEGDDRP